MRRDPGAGLDRIPVLLYHRIAADGNDRFAVRPERFAEHVRLLHAAGRSALTVSALADGIRGVRPLPARPVAITIDDGFADTPRAVVRLVEYGLRVTVFVATGALDRPGRLSIAQLRALTELDDVVELGAHTVTHPYLDALAPREVRRQVNESKQRLEALTGCPVDTFAYPHGAYDAGVRAAVIEAGYHSAAAVKNAFSHRGDDPWAIARYTVTQSTTPARLARILAGTGAPMAWRGEHRRTQMARCARRARARLARARSPVGGGQS